MAKKKVEPKQELVEKKKAKKPIDEIQKGEQMPLIDVLPESAKPIVPVARKYHKIIRERLAIQKKEAEQKKKLGEAVHKANLLPLDNGKILFKWQDIEVEVTPQADKVKVTIKDE